MKSWETKMAISHSEIESMLRLLGDLSFMQGSEIRISALRSGKTGGEDLMISDDDIRQTYVMGAMHCFVRMVEGGGRNIEDVDAEIREWVSRMAIQEASN